MGDSMKVSIIIPAYNAEKYLEKSLDSVVNQVYRNLEIIVRDDASTDNTKNIIKEYANKDDRIIPFYQAENKGVSAARNTGLKAATGDFIMFVDSDDELTKDAIRRMIDLADKYDSDFVDSYHLLYYKKKNGKLVSFTEKKVPKKVKVMWSLKDNIKILDTYTYVTGKLIKKELLDGLTFDESLNRYEDLVLEHQIKPRIKNYVLMNKAIYFYYQREDSLVNTLGKKHLCYLEAAEKVRDNYKDASKEIQDTMEAIMFQNMVFTLVSKVIKNDDPIKDNVIIIKDALNKLIELFPNYEQNTKISKFIKKKVKAYLSDDKKIRNLIKRTIKIDFINIYFNYLSIKNKYEIKNPLE